ncbi:MAG: hypothetical protein ACXWUG_17860 [Polyangiales bacterium]
MTPRRSSTFFLATVPLVLSLAVAPACGPRKGPTGPTQSATIASATPTAPPAATPTTSATTWAIPGLSIPGLPMSPRQALVGRWKVAGVDGKPVATSPGMATDPMDPASYVAGSEVVFTADQVTLSRGGVSYLNRPYKVVQEFPPVRVTIDAGYGASNVDFAIDGSAIWSLPSTPPHALSLTRAQ